MAMALMAKSSNFPMASTSLNHGRSCKCAAAVVIRSSQAVRRDRDVTGLVYEATPMANNNRYIYISMDWLCWENLQETMVFTIKYRGFL